jgi:NADH-quinone oxidoreductase subunit G
LPESTQQPEILLSTDPMPRLTIDNTEIEVPAGTTVLEAARGVGVVIPHFCYHPALGSVGACRLCAMKFLAGPVKGVQMSCMIPAQDGMVVSTTDEEATRLRQLVIEWLMINHPHDCPVCDEGGECLLQDYTIAGGHAMRRYQGKKRTHLNQYLGERIAHEMNRCIQCYRCARFYQDYAGGTDFGVMGSAGRVYFGRQQDGALQSPFSGNLVDICPTGVFTDKGSRFRARYWDYDMAPSICPGCSLGCNTTPAAHYRELLKISARPNDAVNSWFICDQGRFATAAVNDPLRPRYPLIDNRQASLDEAMDALLLRIGELTELYGEGSLAVVGSARLPLEAAILLSELATLLGAGFLCYFVKNEEGDQAVTALSHISKEHCASMHDVRGADCVVLSGVDLLEEGPMLALAVRQAWRNGARVFTVSCPTSATLEKTLSINSTATASVMTIPWSDFRRAVLICGPKPPPDNELEHAVRNGARLAQLFSGSNACGAAILAREHESCALETAVASGKVKGIIAFEADIPSPILENMKLVIQADWLRSAVHPSTDIFLPTASWVEMNGTLVNFEGRAQRFTQVMSAGIPLHELAQELPAEAGQNGGAGASLPPPRQHRAVPPGGELLPSWQLIATLLERAGETRINTPFTGRWSFLHDLSPEGEGIKIL